MQAWGGMYLHIPEMIEPVSLVRPYEPRDFPLFQCLHYPDVPEVYLMVHDSSLLPISWESEG